VRTDGHLTSHLAEAKKEAGGENIPADDEAFIGLEMDEDRWFALRPGRSDEEELLSTYKDFVEKLPAKLQDSIGSVSKETLRRVWLHYQDFLITRKLLYDITKMVIPDPSGPLYLFNPQFRGAVITLHVNKEGYFEPRLPPILEAVMESEPARIRQCEVCLNIFWAGRITMKCCSTKCAHVLRTKRWREKYPSKYKIQRITKSSEKKA
jgi:hypothetical protein